MGISFSFLRWKNDHLSPFFKKDYIICILLLTSSRVFRKLSPFRREISILSSTISHFRGNWKLADDFRKTTLINPVAPNQINAVKCSASSQSGSFASPERPADIRLIVIVSVLNRYRGEARELSLKKVLEKNHVFVALFATLAIRLAKQQQQQKANLKEKERFVS